MKKMDTRLYLNFIKKAIADEGIEVADKANKLALAMKTISIDQYSRAAREIVKAVLAD